MLDRYFIDITLADGAVGMRLSESLVDEIQRAIHEEDVAAQRSPAQSDEDECSGDEQDRKQRQSERLREREQQRQSQIGQLPRMRAYRPMSQRGYSWHATR